MFSSTLENKNFCRIFQNVACKVNFHRFRKMLRFQRKQLNRVQFRPLCRLVNVSNLCVIQLPKYGLENFQLNGF